MFGAKERCSFPPCSGKKGEDQEGKPGFRPRTSNLHDEPALRKRTYRRATIASKGKNGDNRESRKHRGGRGATGISRCWGGGRATTLQVRREKKRTGLSGPGGVADRKHNLPTRSGAIAEQLKIPLGRKGRNGGGLPKRWRKEASREH